MGSKVASQKQKCKELHSANKTWKHIFVLQRHLLVWFFNMAEFLDVGFLEPDGDVAILDSCISDTQVSKTDVQVASLFFFGLPNRDLTSLPKHFAAEAFFQTDCVLCACFKNKSL